MERITAEIHRRNLRSSFMDVSFIASEETIESCLPVKLFQYLMYFTVRWRLFANSV